MLKVSRYGIINFIPMQPNTFLLQLQSGQLSVFNVKTKKVLYTTEVGHTHQIQKCKISPQNVDILGSVGFDGTLRVWDLSKFELMSNFTDRMAKGADKIIQSLCWCPLKPKQNEDDFTKFCVIATSVGKVKLVDTVKNRVIWQEQLSDERIVFDVDWNTNGVLAIGPTGVFALLKKFNRAEKKMEDLGEIPTHSSVRSC